MDRLRVCQRRFLPHIGPFGGAKRTLCRGLARISRTKTLYGEAFGVGESYLINAKVSKASRTGAVASHPSPQNRFDLTNKNT